ncbi:MAG: LysR family transcriptional regulator [Zoogloeaceae bacterium]|nr:LysR family transcriptional regulator [Zoogloeaceae bacterium]
MNKPANERQPRLPSLDPLKGFEAAARHLSFTRAAAELHLTQSAISRQVQTLEEQVGVKLFRREVRRLSLTPEGAVLQRVTAEVLARLGEVCADLRAAQRRPQINLTAAVSIASLWLVPRLAAFQTAQPDVDVRISADNRIVDMEREGYDVALRHLATADAPPEATLLFKEEVFPVAAPALAEALPMGASIEDLARVVLLAYEDDRAAPWLSWEPWLIGLGLGGARPKTVLRFNQYDQLIRAAEEGQGIALGRGPLVARAIDQGRLVPLAGYREQFPARAFYLVCRSGEQRPEVARFVAWLLDEAARTSQAMARIVE